MKSTSAITFRPARREELATIVALLAQDELGQTRESMEPELNPAYITAFEAIDNDPGNEIIVGIDTDGVVGTMQLSYIPNLTFQGATRCQIEGVRIAERARGGGLGEEMIGWAIQRAKEKGCGIVQLTSNMARGRAIAFYENLGFEATHVGFKMYLG